MGYYLMRGEDSFAVRGDDWHDALDWAQWHGWVPVGTFAPLDSDGSELWDFRDYFSNSWQCVIDEDALYLSFALKEMPNADRLIEWLQKGGFEIG